MSHKHTSTVKVVDTIPPFTRKDGQEGWEELALRWSDGSLRPLYVRWAKDYQIGFVLGTASHCYKARLITPLSREGHYFNSLKEAKSWIDLTFVAWMMATGSDPHRLSFEEALGAILPRELEETMA